MRRVAAGVGLVLLCVVVVGIRAVGFEHVFPDDYDGVVLAMDDAQYHARRAAYTFEHFPLVLSFDRYLSFPQGSYVPWPPLYDFALGATARLLGDDRSSLDRVLAWAPVALGLFTALAVFAAGRVVAGTPVALGALGLYALLPASTHYSSVGNPDHHAAVAFVASLLLLSHLKLAAAGEEAGPIWTWQAIAVVVRISMLLTWHGSILYVVLGESLALAVAAVAGRREIFVAQTVGLALTALLGFWSLSMPHSELAGPWSAVELSRLQPAAYAGFAVVAVLWRGWERALAGRGAAPAAPLRLASMAVLGLLVAGGIALLSESGLRVAWDYVSRAEPYIAHNLEAQPLWSDTAAAWRLYAFALALLPVAPVAPLVLARRETLRAPALYLAGWTAVLLVLAVSNARYASDFAPSACLGLALLGAWLVRAVAARWPAARVGLSVAAFALIPFLVLEPLLELVPHAARSLAVLRGYRVVLHRPGEGVVRSAYSFADALRAATPEPGGFLDPAVLPAYGIATPPILGLIVMNLGRRPTTTAGFGPYVGREGFEATQAFYLATEESEALARVRPLRVRYAVSTDEGRARPRAMMQRLQHDDGCSVEGRPALHHLRLVAESPRKGVPLGALRGAAPDFVDTPYKLFEIVEGARLFVEGAPPGAPVSAEVEIETGSGRRFTYRTTARASSGGEAGFRVPYATDATTPARPSGPYRVRSGSAVREVPVLERQIAAGEEVRVRLDVPALADGRASGTLPPPDPTGR